jgi:2-dehydropantoate 2-reductase
MRVVILGAGGVGSVVAGHLARAGVDAIVVARQGHAKAIEENGLNITGLADFQVDLPTCTDASGLDSADVLLITVKTKDTQVALESVKHLKVGCVASLQNGVVKNDQMSQVFGPDKVVGATTMIGATLVKDGEVNYSLDGITFFGERDGRRSDRVDALVQAFEDGGLNAVGVENIVSIEWTKQAIQNPFAPLAAITRMPVHMVWSSAELATLSVHMFREVAAVADKLKIPLSEHSAWSLFNLKALHEAPFEEAVQMLVNAGRQVAASGRTHIIPSMLQDVLASKKTEIEETVGHVFREGKRLGISVPYTEFAYRAVRAIEDGYEARLS